MKISVITCTHNSSRTIDRNITSVNSQDYTNIEHLFIDNASEDATVPKIKQLSSRETKVVSEKDRGISDAFNKGIKLAQGDILSILNSDDAFFDSEVLSQVCRAFQEDPDLQFVYGDIIFKDPVYGTNLRRPLECSIKTAMPYNHPAFFVRRTFYDELGLFDESFKYAMDFELVCRLYRQSSVPLLKGTYLRGKPLAIMYSGGASWIHESKALDEVEAALKKNGLWDREAEKELRKRKKRIALKAQLDRWGLRIIVKMWRFFKWR